MRTEFKLALLVLLIGIIAPSAIFGYNFYFKESHEVQVYNRYYYFSPIEFGLVTMGPFLFALFLVRSIRVKFKETWSNIFLVVGMILMALIVIEAIEILNAS